MGPENLTPAQMEDCTRRGGEVRRGGMFGSPVCIVPYADAGRACRDSDDCEGECRYPAEARPKVGQRVMGQCQADSSPFGCFTGVENGKAEATICND